MNPLEKTLFQGASNTVDFTLADKAGVVIPFEDNGVTLMELYLDGHVLSSVTDDLSWDNVGGVKVKSSDNTDGIRKDIFHSTSLMVYDTLHPEPDDGQLLVNPSMKYSRLKLKIVNPEL